MSSSSPSLMTPQVRRGPSSRLLQRRSLLLQQNQPEFTPPSPVATPPSRRSMHPGALFATSMLSTTRDEHVALDNTTMVDVTKPAYMYHSVASIGGDLNAETGLLATENLFVDFLSSSCELRGGALEEYLDQVAEYENLVQGHVNDLNKVIERDWQGERNSNVYLVKENLSHERNTWRLVGKVFSLELYESKNMGEDDLASPMTEQTVVETLFDKDITLRHAQAIVDWLELNARDDKLDLASLENIYGDTILGWENTLHELTTKGVELRRFCNELDPDARRRTGKDLHDVDKQDEFRLLKLIFACIRAGMLDKVQGLCVEMGQPWRAATLLGWKLSHDPNLGMGKGQVEKMPNAGNVNRDIWKKTAWVLSNDNKMSDEDRAIYSALCGNAKQLISSRICATWDDVLWAKVKSMVDILVEQELRATMPKNYVSMPEEYWSNLTNLSDILQSIKDKEFQMEMSSPFRRIQTCIILKEWDKLFQMLTNWAEEDKIDEVDPHLVRFMCHLILVVRAMLGETNPALEKAKNAVLERYILYLKTSGRVQQVAWYTSQLSRELQVLVYTDFLESVKNIDDQQLCLGLGFEVDLPMKEIRFRLVDLLISAEPDEEDRETSHHLKIRSIDWLLYPPQELEQALKQTNAITRFFIAESDIASAKEALLKIKPFLTEETVDTVAQDQLKEYDCLSVYVTAKESFTDWFEFYHKGKPKKPSREEGDMKKMYTAQVAHDEKEKQYKERMARWHDSLLLLSKEVISKFEAVLYYPGGWCSLALALEGDEEESSSAVRIKELDYLRRTCVVQIVLLLHNVLHDTRQFDRAVRIADLLADEEGGIYTLFSKEDMKQILTKMKESSMALVEQGLDPWGYKTN